MIDALLGFALHLPDWAIYGFVGAILGGLGGLLGAVLQNFTGLRRLSSIFAILGAVSSTHVTKLFVIPAVVTAGANADLPMQIDNVTTLVRIEYTGQRFVYHYELADSANEWADGNALKSALLAQLCTHWNAQFASGPVSGADYHYRVRGRILSFMIEPADCS